MATQFNNFFVSVASKSKEPVENCNFEKLKDFCNSKVPDGVQFNIPEVSCDKVLKFLSNIDIHVIATGCDQIGPRLLKIAAPFIADSITYICSLSIQNSFFHDKWKIGKVTPVHKSGCKDDVNNFRPISVLPILSKILEKHVHDSLMDFLINHSLLHETQSGLRPSFSCEKALLYPPQNIVLGGYTVFSLSAIPSFRDHFFNILLCNFSSSCPILFKFSPHFNHQTLHVL